MTRRIPRTGRRRRGASRPPRPRLGLALCGGGLLGVMYELGALRALDEALAPEASVSDFDMVVGTSAGAIVGMLLANGVRPEEAYRTIMEDEKDLLNFGWRDVFAPSAGELAREAGRMVRRSALALRAVVRGRVANPLDAMEEILPPGLLSLEPVRRYLLRLTRARNFRSRFRNLGTTLWVTAMDLDTGERVVFGPGAIENVAVADAVVASCAIPGVFAPVSIQGRELIDGGTGQVAHIDLLMHAGARTIVVVNPVVPIRNDKSRVCIPSVEGHCASLRDKGAPAILDQAFRILNYTHMEMGLARFQAAHPEVRVLRLEPDPAEVAAYAYNPMDYVHRKEVLEFGYRSTKAQLEDGRLRRALLRGLRGES